MPKLYRCPFHDDRRPSLSVDWDKGAAFCWGCGWHGNTFSLLTEFMSVAEAARIAFGSAPPPEFGVQVARSWKEPAPFPVSKRAVNWLSSRDIKVGADGTPSVRTPTRLLPRFSEGESVLGISVWCYVYSPKEIFLEMWRIYRVMRQRPSYYTTPGFPRARCVGSCGERSGDVVYLVEGVLDGLALLVAQDRELVPQGSVWTTFGSTVSQAQFVIIKNLLGNRSLILAYDNDTAGLDASLAVLRAFPNALCLEYPGVDPGEALKLQGNWILKEGMQWLAERTAV